MRDILDGCPWDIPEDAMHAALEADGDLGVVVVRFTAADPAFEDRLDELAGRAATTCLVEELLLGASA